MCRLPYGRASLIVLLAACVAVSGCHTFGKKKKPELAYEEHPVDLLYNAGATRFDQHQWSDAVDYFREVERQHPYSEWSRRADSDDRLRALRRQRLLRIDRRRRALHPLYPGSPDAAYAYYIKAICYFEQIVDVPRSGRSPNRLWRGAARSSSAIRRPNTPPTPESRPT